MTPTLVASTAEVPHGYFYAPVGEIADANDNKQFGIVSAPTREAIDTRIQAILALKCFYVGAVAVKS